MEKWIDCVKPMKFVVCRTCRAFYQSLRFSTFLWKIRYALVIFKFCILIYSASVVIFSIKIGTRDNKNIKMQKNRFFFKFIAISNKFQLTWRQLRSKRVVTLFRLFVFLIVKAKTALFRAIYTFHVFFFNFFYLFMSIKKYYDILYVFFV